MAQEDMKKVDKQPKKQTKSSQRKPNKVVIGAIIILVLAVAGLIGWLLLDKPDDPSVQKEPTTATDAERSDIDIANSETDFDKGKDLLLGRVSETSSDDEQARTYQLLSQLALNNEKYDLALEYAQTADRLAPTRWTAYHIALSFKALGNVDEAVANYNLAIQRAEEDSAKSPDDESPQLFIIDMKYYIQEISG